MAAVIGGGGGGGRVERVEGNWSGGGIIKTVERRVCLCQ